MARQMPPYPQVEGKAIDRDGNKFTVSFEGQERYWAFPEYDPDKKIWWGTTMDNVWDLTDTKVVFWEADPPVDVTAEANPE